VIEERIGKFDTENKGVYYFNVKFCLIFSCSLNCWKEHKKIKCEYASLPEKTEVTNIGSQEYKHQTEDTVPLDKLKLLGTRDFTQNFSLQAVVVIYAYIEWGT
jgi:hypothetical protein